jgi:hypothetical protein
MDQKPDKVTSEPDRTRVKGWWYTGGICSLCIALSVLAVILLLSILFVALGIPHGFYGSTLRTLISDVFSAVFVPFLAFIAEIIKSLFPWAILAILVLGLLAWGPDRIRGILSSLKLELPGGFKFDAGSAAPDAFKKGMGDAQKIVAKANQEIEEAYDEAKVYASQLRQRYEIDKLVADLSSDIAKIIGETCPEDYRLTLYVPDLVFSDRLFQLVEYYDKKGRRISEGKSGRAFSIRYGIIGRVWRSGVAEVEGTLISAEDKRQLGKNPDASDLEKFIARRWGLTIDEAVRVQPYPSYGAIRIERPEKPLGVVFFDSRKKNAFGDADVREKIQVAVQDSRLALNLWDVSREIASWSRIQIVKNS